MASFQILRNEHEEAKALLRRVLAEADLNQPMQFRAELEAHYHVMQRHMDAEEKYMYPELCKHPSFVEMTEDVYEEHDETRGQLKKLRANDFAIDTHAMKDLIQEMLHDYEHHFDDEEEDLFPKMERDFPQEKLVRMEEEIEAYIQNNQLKDLLAA